MRAGNLRHRVIIEREVDNGPDDVGERMISYEKVAEVWASVEPLRGREFVETRQEQHQRDTRVRMRRQKGMIITPDCMRLVWVDEMDKRHIYDIQDVINVNNRDREWRIMCKERL